MIAASPFPGSLGSPSAFRLRPSDLPGPILILRSVIRTQGVRGLWLGHTGTLIRESGGGVAWFGIKEIVSEHLLSRHATSPAAPLTIPSVSSDAPSLRSKSTPSTNQREKELQPWESALAGACAGVGYTFLFFPADCVKSTIQTEEELRPRAANSLEPKSTFTGVLRQIYRTKGLQGLYAGAGITGFRSAMSSGLMFLIYDALEKHLG
jgi:ornithine carrier protein